MPINEEGLLIPPTIKYLPCRRELFELFLVSSLGHNAESFS
jgi:hypothetical protein